MSAQTITIRFFAHLREDLATDTLEWPVHSGMTAADLMQQLADQGGAWQQLRGERPLLLAVNQCMAQPETILTPGDEVAFFPPVTGG